MGVLALQGAFIEHEKKVQQCGARAYQIRKPQDLKEIDGLIIPGGESTTIGKLIEKYNLEQTIIDKYTEGMPIWGTCAGMILLAREVIGSPQFSLKLMDVSVMRNGFGRQVESSETTLDIKGIGSSHAVFIRAPYIDKVGHNVEVMAEYEGRIVMARQGDKLLATAFHPELTDELSIHKYFLNMV